MLLNYIWAGFFIVAFAVALGKLIFLGDSSAFPAMLQATFDASKKGFEISLGLTGVMTLWLGLMRIGEKGGIIRIFSKVIGPFFSRLFPEVPRDHPANGSILMNFSANLLGLDNAATPLGLKAMQELQELNPNKEIASNAQIMFMVLNTSGLTIIPLSIMADRSVLHAANPADIFIPTLIATFCSSLIGLIVVSIYQRINLLSPVILGYLLTFTGLIAGLVYYFSKLSTAQVQSQSQTISAIIILGVIILFIVLAIRKKVPIFETFIDGAKEGFQTAVKIIPYLVGILVVISVFQVSGTMDYILGGIKWLVIKSGMNPDFTDALPVALFKPLSAGVSRAMMLNVVNQFGVDSFAGRLASIFRGCTETTLYVLALYFGSVNIRKTRYALKCGLLADLAGIVAAIFVGYFFFH